jgi:hypothetical protein
LSSSFPKAKREYTAKNNINNRQFCCNLDDERAVNRLRS